MLQQRDPVPNPECLVHERKFTTRGSARRDVAILAHLAAPYVLRSAVTIIDISAVGARVRTPLKLQIGTTVFLEWEKECALGSVSRAKGDELGIRFDKARS